MAGTLVANTINTDTGLFSTNNAYSGIAKAWVLYNGVGQSIYGSFNVSSVTRNAAGDYTINYTTAMPNINYSALISTSANSGSNLIANIYTDAAGNTVAPTTTTTRIVTLTRSAGASIDSPYVSVVINGA